MPASSSGLWLRLLWRPLEFSLNKCVFYMHINFPWKFHQNVFTLTITFTVLNVSTEFVLIYRPHPVWAQMREDVGIAGYQPMRTALHKSQNKLWKSNSMIQSRNYMNDDPNDGRTGTRQRVRPREESTSTPSRRCMSTIRYLHMFLIILSFNVNFSFFTVSLF